MSAPGTFDPGSSSNSSSTGPDNGFIFGIVGGVLGLFLIVAACVVISRRSSGTYYSEGGSGSMHPHTGHFHHHRLAAQAQDQAAQDQAQAAQDQAAQDQAQAAQAQMQQVMMQNMQDSQAAPAQVQASAPAC